MKSKNKEDTKKSKGRRVVSKEGIEFTIIDGTPDWCNDPFFKKKAEQAAEFVRKHGLPNFPPLEE